MTFAVLAWTLLLTAPQSAKPALPGIDAEGSDPRAIAIADEVMEALGGREAWDATRFLTWKFFGRRTHVWDKTTGNLRFENEDTLVLMNLNTKKGRVWEGGVPVTDAAAVAEALDRAEGAWINDSYWVFMPYKLEDPGVTLSYLGKGRTEAGEEADVLQLTFEGVGRTPQNKYHVFVDADSRLVTQWDYYENASDPEPRFKIPWLGWTEMGGILLSADRGERRHENLAVLRDVPASVFTSPATVDPMRYAVGR
jgi:hypothetical protein